MYVKRGFKKSTTSLSKKWRSRRKRFVSRRSTRGIKRSGGVSRRAVVSRRQMTSGGFPDQYTTTLHYAAEFTADAPSATTVAQTFHANHMHDPDYTGGGHQPYGYDELTALYTNYVVHSSKITVKITTDQTSNLVPGYVCIVRSNEPSTVAANEFSNPSELMESGDGHSALHVYGNNTTFMLDRGQLICGYVAKKQWNVKQIDMSQTDDGLVATTGAAPAGFKSTYFHLLQLPINSNNPGAICGLAKIEYRVTFFNKKNFSQS